jgi:uncharacterized protein
MPEVKLNLDENNEGSFDLFENGLKIGEMVVGILGSSMTVYHTEVDPAHEGKGMAKKLLENMVNYARENTLTVTPLCQYVQAQFRRHPDQYADLWSKN